MGLILPRKGIRSFKPAFQTLQASHLQRHTLQPFWRKGQVLWDDQMIPLNQELSAVVHEACWLFCSDTAISHKVLTQASGWPCHQPFLSLSQWWWLRRFQKGTEKCSFLKSPATLNQWVYLMALLRNFLDTALGAVSRPEWEAGHSLPGSACNTPRSEFGLEYEEYITWRVPLGDTRKESHGDLCFNVVWCTLACIFTSSPNLTRGIVKD